MASGPEIQPDAHVRTGRSRLDVILGVSAIAISLFSALLTLWQGRAMQETVDQNARMVQASTWPYLTIGLSNSDLQGHRLYQAFVVNNGVGPARIRSLTFSYGGRVAKDGNDLARMIAQDAHVASAAVLIHGVSGVLPAHDTIPLINAQPGVSSPEMIAAMVHTGDKVNISVCYCSLFDDCWTTDMQNAGDPKPVKACPRPAA